MSGNSALSLGKADDVTPQPQSGVVDADGSRKVEDVLGGLPSGNGEVTDQELAEIVSFLGGDVEALLKTSDVVGGLRGRVVDVMNKPGEGAEDFGKMAAGF